MMAASAVAILLSHLSHGLAISRGPVVVTPQAIVLVCQSEGEGRETAVQPQAGVRS